MLSTIRRLGKAVALCARAQEARKDWVKRLGLPGHGVARSVVADKAQKDAKLRVKSALACLQHVADPAVLQHPIETSRNPKAFSLTSAACGFFKNIVCIRVLARTATATLYDHGVLAVSWGAGPQTAAQLPANKHSGANYDMASFSLKKFLRSVHCMAPES